MENLDFSEEHKLELNSIMDEILGNINQNLTIEKNKLNLPELTPEQKALKVEEIKKEILNNPGLQYIFGDKLQTIFNDTNNTLHEGGGKPYGKQYAIMGRRPQPTKVELPGERAQKIRIEQDKVRFYMKQQRELFNKLKRKEEHDFKCMMESLARLSNTSLPISPECAQGSEAETVFIRTYNPTTMTFDLESGVS